jgi:hypothetical protein
MGRPGGKNSRRWRMRCCSGRKGCGSRFTLKRPLREYIREVRCPYCKSKNVRDLEMERRREVNKNKCTCKGYPFPHRRGSMRMCDHHPKWIAGVDPTPEEIAAYDQVMRTPRSG